MIFSYSMKKFVLTTLSLLPYFILAQSPRFEAGYPDKGLLNLPLGVGKTELYDAAVLADDKVLICGSIRKEASVNNPGSFEYFDRNYLLIKHLANGEPDSSFGIDGILAINHKNHSEFFYDINEDPQGNIFMLGQGRFETYLAKILPDGNVDKSFGDNGFLLVYDGSNDGKIRDLLITAEGKLLLCGTESEAFFFLQFLNNGNIDTEFGNQGRVHISPGMLPFRDDAIALAQQNRERILVGGESNNLPIVLALRTDGTLDTSFNHIGYLRLESIEDEGRIEKIHLFQDQSFIGAGSKASSPRNAFFISFLADGQLDSTRFGQSLIEPQTQEEQNFRSMAVSTKGEIYYQSFYDSKFLITKLSPQGKLDSTFGFAGQSIFTLENHACFANNVMLSSTDQILMSGSCPPNYALVRLDSLGRFDNSYQQTGFITRKVRGGGSTIWNLHRMRDQSLIGTGHSYAWQAKEGNNTGEVISHGQIWKFDDEGEFQDNYSLPLTPGGRVIVDMAEAHDGDYLLAGEFFPLGGGTLNHEPFIKKINPDGQPDPGFGDEGIVMLKKLFANTAEDPFQMLKISEGPDKKIWIAFHHGFFPFGSSYITKYPVIACLHPDGSLDTSFYNAGYLRVRLGDPLEITDLLPFEDGSIIVSGYAPSVAMDVPSLFVVKITSGEMFQSFGWEVTPNEGLGFPNATVMAGGKIVQKPNGEIIQAFSINGDFLLAYFNADGTLNQAIGDKGIVTHPFNIGNATFSDMALAPNGDVLMLGFLDNMNTGRYEGILICFNTYGELKKDFGDQGVYTFNLGTPYTYAEAISMDVSGNFVVAGSSGSEAFIMRFLSDLHLEDPTTLPPNFVAQPLIYPNPIQGEVTIRYSLASEQQVRIQWLDLLGRQLTSSYEGTQSAGTYARLIRVPSGIVSGYYLVKVQIGNMTHYIKVQVN